MKTKPGVWVCTNGEIASIHARVPEWDDVLYKWGGYVVDQYDRTKVEYLYWNDDGSADTDGYDLEWFKEDKIADPRTWTPPVELSEGFWEDERNGVMLVVRETPRGWEVIRRSASAGTHFLLYLNNGYHVGDHFPRLVRKVGESLLR